MRAKNVQPLTVFWFRRDLRVHDNAGLWHALQSGNPVLAVFLFDREILDKLIDSDDARVEFIWKQLHELQRVFARYGSSILVRSGTSLEVWGELIHELPIKAIYMNQDYEPSARQRDAAVEKLCLECGIEFRSFKDQVIFEKDDVLKKDSTPYIVFTPYSRQWKTFLGAQNTPEYLSEQHLDHLFQLDPQPIPPLEELGFKSSGRIFPDMQFPLKRIRNYASHRNLPGQDATTHLGVHLRFGTISVRDAIRVASELSEIWLNELIWREFFMMILWHFPFVVERSFRPRYDRIAWRNDPEDFRRWCDGHTGYPLVDAGMRELNATGFMHNRSRMVVASFLTKHLLIDWRWGERYFARKLLDYELASNNGNWQWAAGTGCDAAPYFRVFNPALQLKKFDPDLIYVKKWIPEYDTAKYPQPIVEHAFARQRAIETYARAISI